MSTEPAINVENTNTFGNYLVHGIDEIILPEAVSWWPTAPGWKALAVVLIGLLAVVIFRLAKTWWHNRYRREALRQLDEHGNGKPLQDTVAVLPYFIKATALQAYPRQDIAALTGDGWLKFLDSHYPGPAFSHGPGEKLLCVAYQPKEQWQMNEDQCKALIGMSRDWIATHRVPVDV